MTAFREGKQVDTLPQQMYGITTSGEIKKLSVDPNGRIYLSPDSLSGYVPYTGATADVDLGSNNLYVNQIYTDNDISILGNHTFRFKDNDNTTTNAYINYDGTLRLRNVGGSINLQNDTLISGYLGIGINPTAVLHLKAGTATANTAPLKFTTGTLLTTPEQGVLEFADDRLYITDVATQRAIDRTSGVLTSTVTCDGDAAADGTTEVTLFTGSLAANAMKAGNLLKIRTNGVLSSANAAQVVTVKAYIGTTEISSTAITGSTFSSEPWDFDTTLIVRSVGASGSISTHTDVQAGGTVASATSQQYATIETINTTTSEDITVTAQWTAASASNVISAYQGYFEFKN